MLVEGGYFAEELVAGEMSKGVVDLALGSEFCEGGLLRRIFGRGNGGIGTVFFLVKKETYCIYKKRGVLLV